MVYRARSLAFLLAVSIAFLTVLFLWLVNRLSAGELTVAGLACFFVSYLLIYLVFEYVVFRGIDKVDMMLDQLMNRQLKGIAKEKSARVDPFEKLNEDISSFASLKQKEIDDLRKLEAFRKEFIADVSHELKTPIFAAQGFVHTLIDGAVNDKNVRSKFLKKAAKSLDGLDSLVQDLLTLSQIETGDIKMKFEQTDLTQLCEEVIEQFEEKAEQKKIKLRLLGSRHPKIFVYADGKRMDQVITNLISNAINYTPEGGDVTIRFEVDKKDVTTRVSDTGEGIPKEHLHRIFERFYRVDKSRSREKGGTGLGLAIVKHILEGHNSKAEVQSEVGKGSEFSFKLPRTKEED